MLAPAAWVPEKALSALPTISWSVLAVAVLEATPEVKAALAGQAGDGAGQHYSNYAEKLVPCREADGRQLAAEFDVEGKTQHFPVRKNNDAVCYRRIDTRKMRAFGAVPPGPRQYEHGIENGPKREERERMRYFRVGAANPDHRADKRHVNEGADVFEIIGEPFGSAHVKKQVNAVEKEKAASG